MPLYEYRCGKCDRVFEVMQKFADAPLQVHEGCGGAVERLISAPAFQFKGSGWYVTDYARAGGGASGKPNSESKKESGSSESKSETKTESKSETPAAKTPSTT